MMETKPFSDEKGKVMDSVRYVEVSRTFISVFWEHKSFGVMRITRQMHYLLCIDICFSVSITTFQGKRGYKRQKFAGTIRVL
jgi:hypothetical protein